MQVPKAVALIRLMPASLRPAVPGGGSGCSPDDTLINKVRLRGFAVRSLKVVPAEAFCERHVAPWEAFYVVFRPY